MRTTCILLLFLAATGAAFGQRPLPQSLGEFYSYGDTYFLEVVTAPGVQPGKGRAIVNFRLSNDLLTFRRNPEPFRRNSGAYLATPRLYFEAVGSDGVIADRSVWYDTVVANDFAATNSKQQFTPGSVELSLRPGIYVIRYTLEEATPGSGFSDRTAPFKMDDFQSRSPSIGIPLFLRRVDSDTLTPSAIDGGALFGERLRVLVPLASREDPESLRYDLLTPDRDDTTRLLVIQSGFASIRRNSKLGPARVAGNGLRVEIQPSSDSAPEKSAMHTALIDAASDDLDVGTYTLLLTFTAGSSTVVDSVRFSLRWIDMPVSLSRINYAIKTLYPIAVDATIDSLLSGNQGAQTEALRNFWRMRDPTPATRYNEAMAEYYRRVDYAFFNFRSIGQKDGAFTDRGKIYILFGPPSSVTRDLRPDALPREVWQYENAVGRVFVFIDESKTGEYRLAEYHDL